MIDKAEATLKEQQAAASMITPIILISSMATMGMGGILASTLLDAVTAKYFMIGTAVGIGVTSVVAGCSVGAMRNGFFNSKNPVIPEERDFTINKQEGPINHYTV